MFDKMIGPQKNIAPQNKSKKKTDIEDFTNE